MPGDVDVIGALTCLASGHLFGGCRGPHSPTRRLRPQIVRRVSPCAEPAIGRGSDQLVVRGDAAAKSPTRRSISPVSTARLPRQGLRARSAGTRRWSRRPAQSMAKARSRSRSAEARSASVCDDFRQHRVVVTADLHAAASPESTRTPGMPSGSTSSSTAHRWAGIRVAGSSAYTRASIAWPRNVMSSCATGSFSPAAI